MQTQRRGGVFPGACLILALVFGAALAPAWAVTPPRVIELCGKPPIPPESLCNVVEDLHGAFALVERTVADGAEGLPVLVQVPEVVREHLVTVEWYPDPDPAATRPGLMGIYDESKRQILLPRSLGEEPVRAWSAVISHELAHATLLHQRVGADKRPAVACLEHEAEAFKVGIVVYERARRLEGGPEPPEKDVDTYLAEQVDDWRRLSGGGNLTTAGLNDLANRHIFLNGYGTHCNWR